MAWVKIDDHFAEHPKLIEAGPLAMAMQIAGLCYANRYLTDGKLPRKAVARFMPTVCFDPETGDPITWQDVAATLVEAGIWRQDEDGYVIHDYLEYQPSRADVEAEREAARQRMADLRSRRKGKKECSENVRPNNSGSSLYPVPVPVPDPLPNKEIKDSVEPNGPTPPKPKKREPKFDESTTAYQLSAHLRAAILDRDPETKVPDEDPMSLESWAIEADRMLRLDERDPAEAAKLMEWAQKDAFWSANILSMAKFRKQYDKLKRQRERYNHSRDQPKGVVKREYTEADFLGYKFN